MRAAHKAEYPLSPQALRGRVCITDDHIIQFRIRKGRYISRWIVCFPPFLYFISRRCKTISDYLLNEQIRDKEVRVIGANGEQLGIMSSKDAYLMAKDAELDLIKIAPTATPPVCKIADYGKFRYELTRREKEARKKQKVTEIKEIRLSPNIDDNDLNTKANQARKFLQHGDKVKASLKFRGREMAHMSNGKEILDQFAALLDDIAVVDKAAKLEGRNMIMFLTLKK